MIPKLRMAKKMQTPKVTSKDKDAVKTQEQIKKEKQRKEAEAFKRKYFDFYDDLKISVKEDW